MSRTAGPGAQQVFEIAILVTPHFNMAATTGFIDPFRVANYLEGRRLCRWRVVSAAGGEVVASNGLALGTEPLSAVVAAPGLAMVSSSWTPEAHGHAFGPVLRRWGRGGAMLGGIDTGAFILAEAGLLSGCRATVHYVHIDALAELYPDVEVSEALYVIDGDRLTSCGGAASADLALQVLRAAHGVALANRVARYVFHDRLRGPAERQSPEAPEPMGSSAPAKLRAAIAAMERHLEVPRAIPEIAAETGLSPRQLERLFRAHCGVSPGAYYRDIRLDRARSLVTQTEMPIFEVALACGFGSAEHFSRAYRARFGITARADRLEGRVPFEFRAWPMHPARGAGV